MKNATYYIFLAATLWLNLSCDKDEEPVNNTDIETALIGSGTKAWKITAKSNDATETKASCKVSAPQNVDNKWIFKSNGAFEYDNGTITDDESCQEAGCCSDLADLLGKWRFNAAKDSLIITVHARIDNGQTTSFGGDEPLLNSKILKLESNEMILSIEDETATFRPF